MYLVGEKMARQPKNQEQNVSVEDPNDIVKKVARKLQQARTRAGLTQTQLGERAGLKQSYIFELEYGETNITLRTLEKMANALDLEIHDLLPDPKCHPTSGKELGKIIEELERLSNLVTGRLTEMQDQIAQEDARHAKEQGRTKENIEFFEELKKVASVRHSLHGLLSQIEAKSTDIAD
jgi:transcriptional regulator with XRE-family HTH domain